MYNELVNQKKSIALMELGYASFSAILFSKSYNVIHILVIKFGHNCWIDFKIRYLLKNINPENINNRLGKIAKIVLSIDKITLNIISDFHVHVLNNGVYETLFIKFAEVAKVVENVTLDVNFALVNKLSRVFGNMEINADEVIEVAVQNGIFSNIISCLVKRYFIGLYSYCLILKVKKTSVYTKYFRKNNRDFKYF